MNSKNSSCKHLSMACSKVPFQSASDCLEEKFKVHHVRPFKYLLCVWSLVLCPGITWKELVLCWEAAFTQRPGCAQWVVLCVVPGGLAKDAAHMMPCSREAVLALLSVQELALMILVGPLQLRVFHQILAFNVEGWWWLLVHVLGAGRDLGHYHYLSVLMLMALTQPELAGSYHPM